MTSRPPRRLAAPAAVARGIVGALIAGALVAAQGPAVASDEARAAWQYRRPVTLPGGAGDGRFVAIAIQPDVAGRSQPGLADLRLVAADGREVPYVLDVDVPRTADRRRSGRLVASQQDRRRASVWTVDFEAVTAFDRLELELDATDFSKRLVLETSLDGSRWTALGGEASVFDRPWQGRRIRDTVVEQPAPITARYVRLTVDDRRSRPVPIHGVTAVLTTHLGGRRWTRDASLVRLDTPPGGPSRYRVDAPAGTPVERLTIGADDAAFWRDVQVFAAGARDTVEPVSARGPIYRVRLDDADLDAEHLDIDLVRPVATPLIVEIDDGASPPLKRPSVTLSGMERRALASVPATGGVTLYYGNAATRRPIYDLEALRTRLSLVASYPQATLGDEAVNPRYAPLAPMAFLASRGATADTSRWTVARALRIAGRDDIYTLTLAAADLAYLRADLGDLRLVDGERRQVPYVLEPRAAASRVALSATPATPRGGAARTSAWQLSLPEAGLDVPRTAAPLAGIEVTFADAFYTRPAVLLAPDRRAPHGLRVLQETTLRASRRVTGPPEPQVFTLDDERPAALALEVGDGDNAPLTLTGAEAVVWVPRITFKAGAGDYRLLLGNAEAAPPTYDLAGLRHDVLAYSAVPIDATAIQPPALNRDYARGARDVLSSLERGPLLWGALGVSIAALLWLTRRILKAPPSPPS